MLQKAPNPKPETNGAINTLLKLVCALHEEHPNPTSPLALVNYKGLNKCNRALGYIIE